MSERTFIMRPGTGPDGGLTKVAAFSMSGNHRSGYSALVKTEDGDFIGTSLFNVWINDPAGYRAMTLDEAREHAAESVSG